MIEAMKQMLEALESYYGYMEPLTTVVGGPRVPAEQSTTGKVEKAITAGRQAIEQAEKQEQGEPVVFNTLTSLKHKKTVGPIESAMMNITPQPQEFVCSTGLCHLTLTQTNVGIGERGIKAYEAAKERGWVGLSDERLMEMPKQEPVGEVVFESMNVRGSDAMQVRIHFYKEIPPVGSKVYTTPPAAQQQRVLFPTMLRKMWSGSEVQAWLDENVNTEKNT